MEPTSGNVVAPMKQTNFTKVQQRMPELASHVCIHKSVP